MKCEEREKNKLDQFATKLQITRWKAISHWPFFSVRNDTVYKKVFFYEIKIGYGEHHG